MIEGFVSTLRMRTSVPVMWIEAVVNVAMEVVRAVEPGAGPDEHAAVEPLGPVVPVGRAIVWGEVVVTVRANRLRSNLDRDLRGGKTRNAQQSGSQDRKGEKFPVMHVFLLNKKGNPGAKVVMTERDSHPREAKANGENATIDGCVGVSE
jgi:hypothetical protein